MSQDDNLVLAMRRVAARYTEEELERRRQRGPIHIPESNPTKLQVLLDVLDELDAGDKR